MDTSSQWEFGHWEVSQRHIQKDNETKTDNLGQAKDRAQLTATSALSVVHVALLKEVIVVGPEHNPYYVSTLVLICVSLALQITAGIISLLISHIRVYYSRYNDDITEDTCQNLGCCPPTICCVKTSPKSGNRSRKNGAKNDAFDSLSSASDNFIMVDEALPIPLQIGNGDDSEEERDPGCCPCTLTTRIFYDYEYKIMDAYDEWTAEYVELELDEVKAEVNIRYLLERVQRARDRLITLNSRKHEISDEDFSRRAADIQATIDDALHRKSRMESQQRRAATARARGDILWDRSSATRRSQVLKRASFWQHTINYIFYIVFVLNAFITGLGVPGKSSSPSGFPDIAQTAGSSDYNSTLSSGLF